MNSVAHVSDGLKSVEELQVSEGMLDTKCIIKCNKKCSVSNRSRSDLPLDGKLTAKSSKKKRKSDVEVPLMVANSSGIKRNKIIQFVSKVFQVVAHINVFINEFNVAFTGIGRRFHLQF